ncbi:MAG: GTP cyclohydrolase II [Spirochaetaceae bacterium]
MIKLREKLNSKMFGEPKFSLDEVPIGSDGDYADAPCTVELAAEADFPTRFGSFVLYGFLDRTSGKEHTAIVRGSVSGKSDVPVRVHSQCHTGDVWGSLRCDCRDQLEAAIEYISEQECGAVVYLKQEGRGIGLINKIKAYQLQDLGLDTIEANEYLGFPAEARSYDVAAAILRLLEIESVALLTNNPDKINKLTSEGIRVSRRIPVVTAWNHHNRTYMETKKDRMGHMY